MVQLRPSWRRYKGCRQTQTMLLFVLLSITLIVILMTLPFAFRPMFSFLSVTSQSRLQCYLPWRIVPLRWAYGCWWTPETRWRPRSTSSSPRCYSVPSNASTSFAAPTNCWRLRLLPATLRPRTRREPTISSLRPRRSRRRLRRRPTAPGTGLA